MPKRVAVVGAGVEGLSTAWHLQSHGVEVTVLDRSGVGAGASRGNAGWLTPSLVAPLPEPSLIGFGLLSAVRRSSPLHITLRPSLRLWRFLLGFLAHCTPRRWRRGMAAFVAPNALAVAAFEGLRAAGVRFELHPADPFLACFRSKTEAAPLLLELDQLARSGQTVDFDEPEPTRELLGPALSDAVGHVVRLHGQSFIDPAALVDALAASVRDRGGSIREHAPVTAVRGASDGVLVVSAGRAERFDAAVIATGAWLGGLARPHGVRTLVQAGRGYSFSVRPEHMPRGPVYLPAQRVACTPLGADRLQIAGMMEFRSPDAPLDPARIRAIVDASRPFFEGVDWDARTHEWVGPRPCTPDGLPLIGATRTPGVFVNGGYGMWGVTLGPLLGRLLAEQLVTGATPDILRPFDPVR